MAKKVVATLKKEGASANLTKAIKMTRSEKSGAYTFEEKMLPKDMARDFLK